MRPAWRGWRSSDCCCLGVATLGLWLQGRSRTVLIAIRLIAAGLALLVIVGIGAFVAQVPGDERFEALAQVIALAVVAGFLAVQGSHLELRPACAVECRSDGAVIVPSCQGRARSYFGCNPPDIGGRSEDHLH